jgi:hypothetical protein
MGLRIMNKLSKPRSVFFALLLHRVIITLVFLKINIFFTFVVVNAFVEFYTTWLAEIEVHIVARLASN